jgi:uncharacterized protein
MFKLVGMIITLLLLSSAPEVSAASVEDATAANNRGDYAAAFKILQPLAAQGAADAQYSLGVLYANGHGVPQDYVQARQWYEQAAAQRFAEAQYNLGVVYTNGLGVPQDKMRAYMWWSFAAENSRGDLQKRAAVFRDHAARIMTSAQIAEAQRLAQQCQTQQFKGC